MTQISSASQQSPQLKAQLAEIYSEAQTDHWSQAQENQAIDKAINEYGGSSPASETSSTNASSSLIDVSA